jgi:hypothetical protein
MRNIAPFITLGWYTVPMRGELKRREDGTKTEPGFETDWRDKHSKTLNAKASALGGVITGSKSGIIAIDCDNDLVWKMFRSLDPNYEFVFVSKGKLGKDGVLKDCGTIIYKYNPDFPDSFGINDDRLALDVYSENGMVYLPTAANKTKVAWKVMPELKEMPKATLDLLFHLKDSSKPKLAPSIKQNTLTSNCLAPTVKQFVDSGKFSQGLFRIITPRAFRDEAQYIRQGFLHPENIPEGRGSEYMSKISAILGADISIDEELYSAAMHSINELWPDPMDSDRLDATITDPMVEGRSSIDGVTIWQYEEDWAAHRCIMHTKRQSTIELGFDDRRNSYYCVDVANEHVKSFQRDSDLFMYVNTSVLSAPKKPEMVQAMPTINVTTEPNKPFGFFATDDSVRTLNLFRRTPELTILGEPESYTKLYKRPETTIKFLETLVPEEAMLEYLLQFIKRKLTTFEYTPVMLYFLGVPGSGKDTFVGILEQIMGSERIAKPTTREFLEQFNGWALDSYFVQLDEYGDQLGARDKEEALGKFKAYSGKETIQIRQMRTEGYQYKHNMTFISTANKNPFALEGDDRRVALFETPNKLENAEWVDDITRVHDQIMAETKDFAYYLATEIATLARSKYVSPPFTSSKHRLIASSMKSGPRLAYILKHGMMDYLLELCELNDCPSLIKDIKAGRIYSESLEDLYDAMTEGVGEMRILTKLIRANGIKVRPTTINNQKKFYYGLDYLGKSEDESPFEEIEE